MAEAVLSGSAVTVELRENHAYSLYALNSGRGGCLYPLSAFRRSGAVLASARGTWLYRKGLGRLGEQLDYALMWVDAFGLFPHYKDKEGVYSPVPMEEECPKLRDFTGATFEDFQCYGKRFDQSAVPALGMRHLRRAFMFYFAGIGFAALVFGLEVRMKLSRN